MSRSSRVFWPLAVALAAVGAPFVLDEFWLNMVIMALTYCVVVFSINLLTGLAGLLSFGQAGFVGLGAYSLGVLSVNGMSPFLAGVVGVVLATVCGLLLGLPAARLKGHYMAIGTLGFGVLVLQLLNNLVDITRGPMGLLGIPTGGVSREGWYAIVLVIVVGLLWALNYIDRRSFIGVILKSVKHDELAAKSSGIPTYVVKLLAFSLSAGLAGLCGVLLACYIRFLTPDLFTTHESFRYLMMSVVGGIGHATGGLIATLILTALPEALRAFGETNLRLLIYGSMVLGVLWFLPAGIGGFLDRLGRPGGGRGKEK